MDLSSSSSSSSSQPPPPPLRPEWLWSPHGLLSNGYQGLFLWGAKQPGREADLSPPSSAEVKECVELYLYSLQNAFMASCSVKGKKKHRGLLYL
jgi:hypothetical protein